MGEFQYKRIKKVRGKRRHPAQLIAGDVISVDGDAYVITKTEEVK